MPAQTSPTTSGSASDPVNDTDLATKHYVDTANVPVSPSIVGVTPSGPVVGSGSVGTEHVSMTDSITSSRITSMPIDLPAGSGPSLHTLGPTAGQAASGPSMLPRRLVGGYHTPIASPSANVSIAATTNVGYYWPLQLERPVNLANFGMNVTTAATTANGIVSVYGDDGQGRMGGNALFSSGIMALTSTGGKSGTGSVNLGPGWYWLRIGISVTSGTVGLTGGVPLLGITPGGSLAGATAQLYYDLGGTTPPTYTVGQVPSYGGLSTTGTAIPFFQIVWMV